MKCECVLPHTKYLLQHDQIISMPSENRMRALSQHHNHITRDGARTLISHAGKLLRS